MNETEHGKEQGLSDNAITNENNWIDYESSSNKNFIIDGMSEEQIKNNSLHFLISHHKIPFLGI